MFDTVKDPPSTAQSPNAANSEIPVYLNPASGSAAAAVDALANKPQIKLHQLDASAMADAISGEVARGTPRVVVCGGDGTIALAASIVAGSNTALAVLPGGTLNHFARRHGIPTDCEAALHCALHGKPKPVDVGLVNDRLFINTSSLGAYVAFVRTRDFLQRRMHYYSASVLAGLHRLLRLRNHRLYLDARPLRTPLVFIGIGERELRFPFLGDNKSDSESTLHVIAVRHDHWLDALKLAANAALRGIDPLDRDNAVDNLLTREITIDTHGKKNRLLVAVDGELIWLEPPLRYQLNRGGLTLVCPTGE